MVCSSLFLEDFHRNAHLSTRSRFWSRRLSFEIRRVRQHQERSQGTLAEVVNVIYDSIPRCHTNAIEVGE
jgi:hypothetical protein